MDDHYSDSAGSKLGTINRSEQEKQSDAGNPLKAKLMTMDTMHPHDYRHPESPERLEPISLNRPERGMMDMTVTSRSWLQHPENGSDGHGHNGVIMTPIDLTRPCMGMVNASVSDDTGNGSSMDSTSSNEYNPNEELNRRIEEIRSMEPLDVEKASQAIMSMMHEDEEFAGTVFRRQTNRLAGAGIGLIGGMMGSMFLTSLSVPIALMVIPCILGATMFGWMSHANTAGRKQVVDRMKTGFYSYALSHGIIGDTIPENIDLVSISKRMYNQLPEWIREDIPSVSNVFSFEICNDDVPYVALMFELLSKLPSDAPSEPVKKLLDDELKPMADAIGENRTMRTNHRIAQADSVVDAVIDRGEKIIKEPESQNIEDVLTLRMRLNDLIASSIDVSKPVDTTGERIQVGQKQK